MGLFNRKPQVNIMVNSASGLYADAKEFALKNLTLETLKGMWSGLWVGTLTTLPIISGIAARNSYYDLKEMNAGGTKPFNKKDFWDSPGLGVLEENFVQTGLRNVVFAAAASTVIGGIMRNMKIRTHNNWVRTVAQGQTHTENVNHTGVENFTGNVSTTDVTSRGHSYTDAHKNEKAAGGQERIP